MAAPYVQLLEDKIGCTEAVRDRALLVAELGCYLARVGQFSEAEAIRVQLRHGFGDGRDVRVSIMIMCLEGLIGYFQDLDSNAYDRLARARLLSVAASNKPLIALTSAWLAHMYFNKNRFQEMADELRACLESISRSETTAACRVSLVLGDAFTYAGEIAASRKWYALARNAALEVGDQASIGALTYNKAALSVFALRMRAASGPVPEDAIRFADSEVRTAFNYQSVADLRSLDHLLTSAKIGSLMLQRRYGDALHIIDQWLEDVSLVRGSSQQILLQADLALCLASGGAVDAAKTTVEGVVDEAVFKLATDDQILVRSSLCSAAQEIQLQDVALHHSMHMVRLVALHQTELAALKTLLIPFESIPSSLTSLPGN